MNENLLMKKRKIWIDGIILLIGSSILIWQSGLEGSFGGITQNRDGAQKGNNERFPFPIAKDPRIEIPSISETLDPGALERFLEESGNSPESITLAYLVSHDPTYLERLKNHTDSEFALQILSQFDIGIEFRLHWTGLLIKKNPNNGLGYLLKAKALIESGKVSAATDAINAALEAGYISSAENSFPEAMLELLEKVSPSRTTQFAIHTLVPAQTEFLFSMLPNDFTGLFEGRSEEEARSAALDILKLLQKAHSGDHSKWIYIQDFSELRDAALGIRVGLLVDYERRYGKGSSTSIDPIGLEEILLQSNSEASKIKESTRALTPSEVDKRVNDAIKNISTSSNIAR